MRERPCLHMCAKLWLLLTPPWPSSGDVSCPVTSSLVFAFVGTRASGEACEAAPAGADCLGADPNDGGNLGSKGLALLDGAVFGAYGAAVQSTWLRLTQPPSGNTITVSGDVSDWPVGGTVLVTATGFIDLNRQELEHERRLITAVSGNTVTLSQPLTFDHLAGTERTDRRAAVRAAPRAGSPTGRRCQQWSAACSRITVLRVYAGGVAHTLNPIPRHFALQQRPPCSVDQRGAGSTDCGVVRRR